MIRALYFTRVSRRLRCRASQPPVPARRVTARRFCPDHKLFRIGAKPAAGLSRLYLGRQKPKAPFAARVVRFVPVLDSSGIFSQVLKLFSRGDFEEAVTEHKAERHARGFTSWGQFMAM